MKLSDLEAIKERTGSLSTHPDRQLAFSVHVPYFATGHIETYQKLLDRIFELAQQAEMPVLIGLDGFAWWGGRPDLWNWWDANKPGYRPENRHNVEWTDWTPDHAVRGGWRNWGNPFPMNEPHPNLASETVIRANQEAIRVLAPRIARWYRSLPESQKYLLAAVKIGWEVNIGVNYYYPKDITTHPDFGRQIGYAAVHTLQLATSGTLNAEHLTICVQNYLNQLTRCVYEAGIPRNKIITHVGASTGEPKSVQYILPQAALTDWAMPGFSDYTGAKGPHSLIPAIQMLNEPTSWWGNVEWGGPGSSTWDEMLDRFEQSHNCKIVTSFVGLHAPSIKQIINTPPRIPGRRHWVHPAMIRASTSDTSARLEWDSPTPVERVYLNVTTSPKHHVSGRFETVNILNEDVSNTNQRLLHNLEAGTYYWMIVADGRGRRVFSDVGTFVIG